MDPSAKERHLLIYLLVEFGPLFLKHSRLGRGGCDGGGASLGRKGGEGVAGGRCHRAVHRNVLQSQRTPFCLRHSLTVPPPAKKNQPYYSGTPLIGHLCIKDTLLCPKYAFLIIIQRFSQLACRIHRKISSIPTQNFNRSFLRQLKNFC